jgi:hypothetical protein
VASARFQNLNERCGSSCSPRSSLVETNIEKRGGSVALSAIVSA